MKELFWGIHQHSKLLVKPPLRQLPFWFRHVVLAYRSWFGHIKNPHRLKHSLLLHQRCLTYSPRTRGLWRERKKHYSVHICQLSHSSMRQMEVSRGSAYISTKLKAMAMSHVIEGWFDQSTPLLLTPLKQRSWPSTSCRGSHPFLCRSIKVAEAIHRSMVRTSTPNLTNVKTLPLPANGLPRWWLTIVWIVTANVKIDVMTVQSSAPLIYDGLQDHGSWCAYLQRPMLRWYPSTSLDASQHRIWELESQCSEAIGQCGLSTGASDCLTDPL